MNKKKSVFFVLVAFLTSAVYFLLRRNHKKNLKHIFLSKSTVIDVRSPEEYALNHFETAINIPIDELQKNLSKIKTMPKPIVLYCRTGNRSKRALTLLKSNGIKNIYNGINQETLENAFSW